MTDPSPTAADDATPEPAGAEAAPPALRAELVPAPPKAPARQEFLPALRADLAPLIPPVRRAATVVAVAALADWVVRAGSRRVLGGGIALLSRAPAPTRPLPMRQTRSETVIVERIIIHRS